MSPTVGVGGNSGVLDAMGRWPNGVVGPRKRDPDRHYISWEMIGHLFLPLNDVRHVWKVKGRKCPADKFTAREVKGQSVSVMAAMTSEVKGRKYPSVTEGLKMASNITTSI